jgi:hypothetical protein
MEREKNQKKYQKKIYKKNKKIKKLQLDGQKITNSDEINL